MEQSTEWFQIHAAPGTCCPEMSLGNDGICKECGTDHKMDAVIAELVLRRDWAEKWANKESRKAARMPEGGLEQRYHQTRSSTYRLVRNHIKARIRYLQRKDHDRKEQWLAAIPIKVIAEESS